jgi:hypothetical protein
MEELEDAQNTLRLCQVWKLAGRQADRIMAIFIRSQDYRFFSNAL